MTKPVDIEQLRTLLTNFTDSRVGLARGVEREALDAVFAALALEQLPLCLDEIKLLRRAADAIYVDGMWKPRAVALLENRVRELEGDLQLERARNRDLLQRVKDLINTFGG